jgi:hypothetical protein
MFDTTLTKMQTSQSSKRTNGCQSKDGAKVSDLVDKQMKDAIDAELATKGLTKVEGDDANL